MRKNTKRSAVIAGVAAVAIGGGAAAWAFGWGVDGEGSGTAEAANIVKLSATSTLATKVYPGAKVSAPTVVTNTNDFGVKLDGQVAITGVTTPGSASTGSGALAPAGNACTQAINASFNPKSSALITAVIGSSAPTVDGKNNAWDVTCANGTQAFVILSLLFRP